MSKSPKRIDLPHPGQRTIFEELRRAQVERSDGAGTMCCGEEIRAALNIALKKTSLSRYEVAGRMSHLLNCQITKEMIDSWTAESKPERRIPGEFVPAFCVATGDSGALLVQNRKCDLFAFAGPEALKSEIDAIKEEIKEKQKEVRRRQELLQLFNSSMCGEEMA